MRLQELRMVMLTGTSYFVPAEELELETGYWKLT